MIVTLEPTEAGTGGAFLKKKVFKYFAKFTGYEVCEIFKNTFFTEHLRESAFENICLLHNIYIQS